MLLSVSVEEGMSIPTIRFELSTNMYFSDKDVESVADALPTLGPKIGWDLRF